METREQKHSLILPLHQGRLGGVRIIVLFLCASVFLITFASSALALADSPITDATIGCCVVTGSGEQTRALQCRAGIAALECRKVAGLIGGTPHVYPNNPTCSEQDTCFMKEWKPIFINTYIPGLTKKAPDPGAFSQTEKYYVSGVGEYIKTIYNFVVSAVAFLAVIMITIGGFKWLTAAGNPERIGDAQKTILNSVMGVVLALLSYTILNLINPNLTSFRQIRPLVVKNLASLTAECVSMKDITPQIFVTPVKIGGQEREFSTINGSEYVSISSSPDTCGEQYYIKERGGSCRGTACAIGQVCTLNAQNQGYECKQGILSGTINFEQNAYIDEMRLWGYCTTDPGKSAGPISFAYTNLDEQTRNFVLTPTGGASTIENAVIQYGPKPCDPSNMRFYLKIEINDDASWWTPTWDDTYNIGPGAGCGGGRPLSDPLADSTNLFTLAQLTQGAQCTINITRGFFPTE